MAYEALAAYRHERLSCRFVSNVDSHDLLGALSDLDPATTLFVVASKTFTTSETLANAASARRWSTDALGDDAVARHFVAVSADQAAVTEFGIDAANMFEMWDWSGPLLGGFCHRSIVDGSHRAGAIRRDVERYAHRRSTLLR